MRVVQINLTARQGGTGRVVYGIADALCKSNIECYTLFSSGVSQNEFEIKYASDKQRKINALLSKMRGNYGFNSRLMTKNLISHLERLKPDVIHLHNLHGHNVNLKMLFGYFKKNPQIKLVWTFHDMWAFTGYCPYFDMVGCEKWKTECKKCPRLHEFSWLFDKSEKLYNRKKKLFEGLNLTVTAPSNYVAEKARQSFFKDYEIKVIYNGIDLDVFKPTDSDFREKYSLQDKKIVLGVAAAWDKRKGLDAFTELSYNLSDKYQIVLVGTNDKIDKILPSNIISIHKTTSVKELTEIYTAADVFVNPTLDEAFGMVNVEALACGTPVITYNSGGSPECIDESCGIVVEKHNLKKLAEAIYKVCEENKFSANDCCERAKLFDKSIVFEQYIQVYSK